ncbi:hypothetical protein [Schlesneria paludicola]|uniref:hypothetical protein n=1 Tax=Schlesneria paludicola TaxID=360056 RepID=UPI000299EC35|nr:hypothetical protein [Schlesneria paludicola]
MTNTSARIETTGRQPQSGYRGFATCLAIVFFTGRLIACDFCLRLPRVPFEFDHPAAIEVAMATQTAGEQGELDLNPLIRMDQTREVALAEVSAQNLVAQWIKSRPAQPHPALRCTLELVFIDVDDTCWLDIRSGEILPSDPRNGPADIRLMTTKVGFCQLREIGLAKCEQLQWAAVDFKHTSSIIAINHLFSIHTTPNPTNFVFRDDHARRRGVAEPNEKRHQPDLKLGAL